MRVIIRPRDAATVHRDDFWNAVADQLVIVFFHDFLFLLSAMMAARMVACPTD